MYGAVSADVYVAVSAVRVDVPAVVPVAAYSVYDFVSAVVSTVVSTVAHILVAVSTVYISVYVAVSAALSAVHVAVSSNMLLYYLHNGLLYLLCAMCSSEIIFTIVCIRIKKPYFCMLLYLLFYVLLYYVAIC